MYRTISSGSRKKSKGILSRSLFPFRDLLERCVTRSLTGADGCASCPRRGERRHADSSTSASPSSPATYVNHSLPFRYYITLSFSLSFSRVIYRLAPADDLQRPAPPAPPPAITPPPRQACDEPLFQVRIDLCLPSSDVFVPPSVPAPMVESCNICMWNALRFMKAPPPAPVQAEPPAPVHVIPTDQEEANYDKVRSVPVSQSQPLP